MKKYILIVFILVAIVANATDNTSTSWVLRASGAVFGSTSILPSRSYGVSFAIGNQGYMATGEGPSTLTSALSDCWRYINNGNWDIWAQQADVPGGGRTQAFGFAINGLGYVGGGAGPFLSFSSALYDFYEYNPGTNVWTSKASFITTTTFGVGFIPADRVGSASFVFPNPPFATEAYVIGGGSGLHTSGSAKNTGIQYNPSTNSWTGNNLNFPVPIYDAVGFTLGGNGYVTCGVAHGLSYNPTYRYDGLWHADSNFPGSAIRGKPFVFTVGNFAYAGSGYSSTAANLSDVWSFSVASGWNCAIPSFVGGNLAGTTAFTLTVNGIQRPFVQNGTILNIGGLPPQIPNNLNNEYQPLFVSTTIPGICTPTILGIPFYNDCNYPTGTVFTAQLVTFNGVAYTVVQNLATTTTGGSLTGMFNVTFLSSLTPSGNYALRITASNGPVLMSNITNFFNIHTAPLKPNALSGPASICAGSNAVFFHNESYITATGSAGTFIWSVSGNNTSYVTSVNGNFTSAPPNTNYQNLATVSGLVPGVSLLAVYAYDPSTGCMSPLTTITTTVVGPAIPTISGTSQICSNTPYYYNVASQTGINFKWGFTGTGTNNFSANLATVTGTSPGLIRLVVTAAGAACTVTSAVFPITVSSPPSAISSITGPNKICTGKAYLFSITSVTGYTYSWSITGPAAISGTGNVISVTGSGITGTGIAYLSVSYFNGGCGGNPTSVIGITVDGRSCCRDYFSNISTVSALIGTPATATTINGGGGTMLFDGQYLINGFITLMNGSFILKPGTTFYMRESYASNQYNLNLSSNANLTMAGASIKAECDVMWYAIIVQSTSSVNFTSGNLSTDYSQFSDAQWGLIFYNADFKIKNTKFTNNYRALSLEGPTPVVVSANNYVINNVFDAQPANMKIPYNSGNYYPRTHLNMLTHNFKNVSVSGNTFDNCASAIGMDYVPIVKITNNTIAGYINGIVGFDHATTYNWPGEWSTVTGNIFNVKGDFLNMAGENNTTSYNDGINIIGPAIIKNNLFYSVNTGRIHCQGLNFAWYYKPTTPTHVENNTFTGLTVAAMDRSAEESGLDWFNAAGHPAVLRSNYFYNNTVCSQFTGGTANVDFGCNTFSNSQKGVLFYTNTTMPHTLLNNAAGARANKFISVTNQIYADLMPGGTYTGITYNAASDEGSGNFAFGPNATIVGVSITGTTVFAVCGTSTPGLRLEYKDEASAGFTESFSVYPNPFNDELNVEFSSVPDQVYEVELFNTLGFKISSYLLKANDVQSKVVVRESLPDGIYIIKLKDSSDVKIAKVMKNN